MDKANNKSKIVIFSEILSLLTSLLIGILSYIPYNKPQMVIITNYINFSKSFNLVNVSFLEFIHHIINGFLSILLIYGNNLQYDNHINNYNIIVQTNISTIFLILGYYYKNKIIKILFIITFLYYRSRHFYYYFTEMIRSNSGFYYICKNHPIVSDLNCFYLLNYSNLFLCILNTYWTILIFNKILGNKILFNKILTKEKILFLLKNSSSLIFLLPVFFLIIKVHLIILKYQLYF